MEENRSKIILAVDDSTDNLSLLQAIFKNAGYQARLAPNGELALRSIEANTPDLILLDINMPDMSGIEICKIIRQDLKLLDIPILFVSGAFSDEQREKILAVGGSELIGKPYRAIDLIARIEHHLN